MLLLWDIHIDQLALVSRLSLTLAKMWDKRLDLNRATQLTICELEMTIYCIQPTFTCHFQYILRWSCLRQYEPYVTSMYTYSYSFTIWGSSSGSIFFSDSLVLSTVLSTKLCQSSQQSFNYRLLISWHHWYKQVLSVCVCCMSLCVCWIGPHV